MSRRADTARSSRVRALRIAGTMARPALCRVRGKEARLRRRTIGHRLRRESSCARPGLEGARATPTRVRGCGARRRRDSGTGSRVPRPGSGRSRAGVAPRRRPCENVGRRACAALGPATARRPRAKPSVATAARVVARRAAKERSRQRRCPLEHASRRLRRRRRLHLGSHGRRLCQGVSAGRSAACSRHDPCAGSPLDWD